MSGTTLELVGATRRATAYVACGDTFPMPRPGHVHPQPPWEMSA